VLFVGAMLLAMGGFPISQSGWPGVGRGVTIIFSLLAAVLALVWFVQGVQHMAAERKNQSQGEGHEKR